MKANELRVGDVVYKTWVDHDGEHKIEHEVSGNDIENLEVNGCFYQAGEPEGIPLTEEWLEKFGFKEGKNGWYSIKYNSNNIMTTEAHSISVNIESARCSISFIGYYNENGVIPFPNPSDVYTGIDIQYVHQLQNLYHALTGEELRYAE